MSKPSATDLRCCLLASRLSADVVQSLTIDVICVFQSLPVGVKIGKSLRQPCPDVVLLADLVQGCCCVMPDVVVVIVVLLGRDVVVEVEQSEPASL